MARFFYPASRAHHAVCVALDFGVEFERRFGKWEPRSLLHLPEGSGYRIYIHRDSVGLLAGLPETKQSALRALGMWPDEEP